MEGLTRTAKFAGLRDQLTNDKESEVTSKDLSSYQDRFNNVQGMLEPNSQRQEASFVEPEYNEPLYSAPVYQAPSFEQNSAPINNSQVYQQQPQFNESLYSAPVYQAPSFEKNNVNINPQQQQANDYFNFFNSASNNQAPINNNNNDFSSYFDNTLKEIDSSFDSFGMNNNNNNNINPFNNNPNPNPVRQEQVDNYLDRTFDDVARWNANNGQKTIENIVDASVDEVRHSQVQPQTNVYGNAGMSDDELSRTLSMEISKIMDDISNTTSFNSPAQNVPPVQPVQTPVTPTYVQQPQVQVQQQVPVTPVQDQPQVQPQVQQQATIEQEPVEIKNIAEVQPEANRDTISQTLSYVVSSDKEELIEDEYEDEGSNTVLNVILIILIVILVAVLGLIVFYILKTQGIL